MNPEIFRAYDVRGVAERDLDDAFVTDLGRAFGTVIRRDGGRRVAVGRDARTHSPRLWEALRQGLEETGLELLDVGVVPSPLLYFAVHHLDTDGGVQITGSHNPADQNGFKLMRGRATLHGDEIQDLRRRIEERDFDVASERGSTREAPVTDAYVDDVVSRLRLGERPLKLVLDGGNGVGGPPALALLERLGVSVVPLYTEPDGTFPNHHPDPTVESNLADLVEAVRRQRADLGVAYDGDADRIGVVDDKGGILRGDRLLILLAREVLRSHPGAAIVSEVKCSRTLFDDVAARGGRPVMSRVGHSIIKERMEREDALLAGEMSGHIFFRERWYGFDDAVYTTGRLLEVLTGTDRPLSELLSDVPATHATPEIRLDCPDDRKFAVVEEAVRHFRDERDDVRGVNDIDGARIDFGEGWGLVRASNTQPVLVLRAEADTPEARDRIRDDLEGFVAARARSSS